MLRGRKLKKGPIPSPCLLREIKREEKQHTHTRARKEITLHVGRPPPKEQYRHNRPSQSITLTLKAHTVHRHTKNNVRSKNTDNTVHSEQERGVKIKRIPIVGIIILFSKKTEKNHAFFVSWLSHSGHSDNAQSIHKNNKARIQL